PRAPPRLTLDRGRATRSVPENFRIVQLSIQRTHVHLIVEADNKQALATGMQGFQVSAVKHLNAAISKDRPGPPRRGTVFPDRYHAEIITSCPRHSKPQELWRSTTTAHLNGAGAPLSDGHHLSLLLPRHRSMP